MNLLHIPLPDRHVCTAADPWTPEKAKHAAHPDAVSTGWGKSSWSDSDTWHEFHCPNCNLTFRIPWQDE